MINYPAHFWEGIAFVGAQFLPPFIDNSNATEDTTKQGVMNHAPTNITERQRRASTLEKQVDEIVYALYGLTPDEIALVDGKG